MCVFDKQVAACMCLQDLVISAIFRHGEMLQEIVYQNKICSNLMSLFHQEFFSFQMKFVLILVLQGTLVHGQQCRISAGTLGYSPLSLFVVWYISYTLGDKIGLARTPYTIKLQ